MQQKIIRSGRHSLAVIIPAQFVHSLGIKPAETVQVQTNIDRGTIFLRFAGAVQLPLPTTKSSFRKKGKNK